MFTEMKKVKTLMCIVLLLVVLFSSLMPINVQAQTGVAGSMHMRPAFGFLDFGEIIYNIFNDIYQGLSDFSTSLLTDALFDNTSASIYFTHDAGDGNNIQKWFTVFEIAGLMCLPLIAIKVGLLLIGSFVSPGKRDDLKDFIKTTMLVIIILVCAKTAVLMLIELNDTLVAFFKNAASAIATPMLPKSLVPGIGSLLAIIFAILMVLANLCLMIYVYIMLFIRKVIIAFAYMLIPVAAVMLYSKKFRSVFSKLYSELLAVIFQQTVYAGVYVILYDVLLQVFIGGKSLAEIGKVGAFGAILGEGWFLQAVYVSYDGTVSSNAEAILGPLGFAILLWLLIKVTKKIQKLFDLEATYAPDAGKIMSGAFAGAKSLAAGVGSFADVWKKTADGSGKTFKERWNEATSKEGLKGFKGGLKAFKGGAGELLKSGSRWGQRIGIPTAALGMSSAGIASFNSVFGDLAAASEGFNNAKDKFKSVRDGNIDARKKYLNDESEKALKKNNGIDNLGDLSEEELKKLPRDYYKMGKGLYAYKDKDGKFHFAKEQDGKLDEIDSKHALGEMGIKSKAALKKLDKALKKDEFVPEDYGFRRFIGPQKGEDGKYKAISYDYAQLMAERHRNLQGIAEGKLSFGSLGKEFEELEKFKGEIDTIVKKGNEITGLKFNRQTGEYDHVASATITDPNKLKEVNKSLGLNENDSEARIARVRATDVGIETTNLQRMNALDKYAMQTVEQNMSVDKLVNKHDDCMKSMITSRNEADKLSGDTDAKRKEVEVIQKSVSIDTEKVGELNQRVSSVEQKAQLSGQFQHHNDEYGNNNMLIAATKGGTASNEEIANASQAVYAKADMTKQIGQAQELLKTKQQVSQHQQVLSSYDEAVNYDKGVYESSANGYNVDAVRTEYGKVNKALEEKRIQIGARMQEIQHDPSKVEEYDNLNMQYKQTESKINECNEVLIAATNAYSSRELSKTITAKTRNGEGIASQASVRISELESMPDFDKFDSSAPEKQEYEVLTQQSQNREYLNVNYDQLGDTYNAIKNNNIGSEEFNTTISKMVSNNNSKKAELITRVSQAKSDPARQNEVKVLEVEIAAIDEQNSFAEDLLSKTKSVGEVLKGKIDRTEAAKKEIEIKVEELVNRNPDVTKIDEAELIDKIKSLEETHKSKAEQRVKIETIIKKAQSGQIDENDRKIFVEVLESENNDIKNEMEALKIEIGQISVSAEDEKNIEDLKQKLESKQKEIEEQMNKLSKLNSNISANDTQMESLNSQVKEYEERINDLLIQISTKQNETFNFGIIQDVSYMVNNKYTNSRGGSLEIGSATENVSYNDALVSLAQEMQYVFEQLKKKPSDKKLNEMFEEYKRQYGALLAESEKAGNN